jgi:hypothetical protein
VAFFVWLAALGKILTLDNLRKKNIVLINRCGMCKRDEETIDHLLLHCECAEVLWNAFFSRFGLVWTMPRGVVNLLQCWWSGVILVVPWFGKWFRIASCSVYGPNRTGDFLTILKDVGRICYISFLLPSSLGW